MKKLNIYYIVSIISLVFMMLILFSTLQVTGWFEKHQGKTPAEWILQTYPGDYQLDRFQSEHPEVKIKVEPAQETYGKNTLIIRVDSLPRYLIELNDFEDEQILIEIYSLDSTRTPQRLEGCELLLSEDEAENFKGSTLGDFCGLKEQSSEYLAVDLLLSGPMVSLKIQTHVQGQTGSSEVRKYLLERVDSW